MEIVIHRRTVRNTCYSIDGAKKSNMLTTKFEAWIARNPSYKVVDNAK